MKRLYADLGLLAVALIWGATFPVVKVALEFMSPFAFNAVRFIFTGLLFLPFLRMNEIRAGIAIGSATFLGYAFQTAGLQYTTATNAGFITSVYIVITPILAFLLYRERVSPIEVVAVILAFAGIYLLSGYSGFNYGDLLILLCAIAFALEIAMISHYAKNLNPLSLAGWQVVAVGMFSALPAVFTTDRFALNSYVLFALLLTGLLATFIAKILQNYMQAHTKSVDAGIILSMEGVFSYMFAAVFLSERLDMLQYAGVALLFVAVLLVSLRDEVTD
ncbi:DMT family transporter [Geoglobus acetivorans]|uniref:Transporter, Drug/metabolite exporter family n=1 Tax=Geoglobus acetivorans TaxID=565033 RepID=A0A0A7GHC1_GEOAI|nr:transporter, Drug/metabolite exporter family [Geoglobus acetivorans]